MTDATADETLPPAFGPAAIGHYSAAVLADQKQLRGPADHLAGLAAECALKAILMDHLGSELNDRGRPYNPALHDAQRRPRQDRKEYEHGHLPDLWGHLEALAVGRVGQLIMSKLPDENHFEGWDVAGRYADGETIAADTVTRHLTAARTICGAYVDLSTTGAI
ncbi:hypothetical protein LN042_10785 [Kitasatospora sp. RB6PN24]|uniref:hypothetical protein n=1 Tax=Kitasatospora humi TaxID=2893891 RepID=UPI001E2DA2F6|nr:hypothetical protein [Kitasatospora humi]MCC9307581.1 hypothetical protein [Kitasatospora humi]